MQDAPLPTEFWNPGSWTTLAHELGLGGFLFIVLILLFSFFAYKTFKWTIGENGWLRGLLVEFFNHLKSFTTTIEENSTAMKDTLSRHMDNCDGYHKANGPCSVVTLQEAAHEGIEVLRAMSIGTANEREIGDRIDHVHTILRGTPVLVVDTRKSQGI